MTYRYCEPISLKDARTFMRLHISERANIPHGSKCYWIAGLRWITDQPGLYLTSGSTGMEGVLIIAPAVENVGVAS